MNCKIYGAFYLFSMAALLLAMLFTLPHPCIILSYILINCAHIVMTLEYKALLYKERMYFTTQNICMYGIKQAIVNN